jgi:Rrf2 family protein
VRVTAKVDYALRAALELAGTAPGTPVKGDVLAEAQQISVNYLENILLELRRAGIVRSQRGADGGYWLAKPADEVTVADIIRAVEGPLANVRGERPEALEPSGQAHHVRELWVATRAALRTVLEGTTLADLVAGELPPAVKPLLDDPEAWQSH